MLAITYCVPLLIYCHGYSLIMCPHVHEGTSDETEVLDNVRGIKRSSGAVSRVCSVVTYGCGTYY